MHQRDRYSARLTSERFLSKIDIEIEDGVVTLDSIRDKVSLTDKAVAFIQANLIPLFLLKRLLGLHRIKSDDLLTVIFTSGSTGMPKGSCSHSRISVTMSTRSNERSG